MKNRLLSFFIALSFSWTPLFANFTDEYLDGLLDEPESMLEILITNANVHKAQTKRTFQPEDLNLIGALAKREYERSIIENPVTPKDLDQFSIPEGGHVEMADLYLAHRFEGIFQNTHKLLRKVYKDEILEKPVRVINNVGQVLATMEIFSCSMTEYIAMFGAILPQEGYSGSYSVMDVFDIMVDGVMRSHSIGRNATLPVTYGPGEISWLRKGERRLYDMTKGAMMIDYGRGFILPALTTGVFRPAHVNGDFRSMSDQLGQCAKSFLTRWFKPSKHKHRS